MDNTGSKIVFFACGLRGKVWAIPLEAVRGSVFRLSLVTETLQGFEPVQDLVRKRLGTVQPDIAIYKLDLELRNLVPRSEILLSVEGAELVELQPHRRQGKHMDGADEEVSDFESMEDFFVSRPDSESECTLASDVESGAEDEAEECPQEEEAAEETDFGNVERLAPGSHVVFNNGYFTLANYALVGPNTDAKMIVAPRFCVAPAWAHPRRVRQSKLSSSMIRCRLRFALTLFCGVGRCGGLLRVIGSDILLPENVGSKRKRQTFEQQSDPCRPRAAPLETKLQTPRSGSGLHKFWHEGVVSGIHLTLSKLGPFGREKNLSTQCNRERVQHCKFL